MSEAVATLPWVESSSIRADRKTRQVRFTIKSRSAFNPQAVIDVIAKHGYRRARHLAGPTES